MSELEIPVVVQEAILKSRKHFHDLDANARRNSNGLSGFSTKPLELVKEKQFWTIQDDDDLHDFLFEDLLALYGEIDLTILPIGYKPLLLVLEFERHCDFSGWHAVENKTDNELGEIIESYDFIELKGEAKALRAVVKAYALLSDSMKEDLNECLGKAYGGVDNDCSDPDDRMEALFAFVRKSKSLFV